MMSGICKMRIYSQTRFLCFYSSTQLLSPHNNLVVCTSNNLHIMRRVSFFDIIQTISDIRNLALNIRYGSHGFFCMSIDVYQERVLSILSSFYW